MLQTFPELNFLQKTQWKHIIYINPRSGGSRLQRFGVVILSDVLFKNEQYFIMLFFHFYLFLTSSTLNFYWPGKLYGMRLIFSNQIKYMV